MKTMGYGFAGLLTVVMALHALGLPALAKFAELLFMIAIWLLGALVFIGACINAVNRSGSDSDWPGGDGGGG